MSLMKWDESLDVGVEKMNDEHKQILDLMNRIHDASERGETGASVVALVDQLGKVTVQHFKAEEAYMASVDYPKLRTHQLIHQDLLTRFGEHAQEVQRTNGQIPDQFLMFLKRWLTAHIKGIDMQYSPKSVSRMAS